MDKGSVSIAAALIILGLFFLRFEKNHFSVKEISVIVVLVAIASLGRIPFAAFPNVQPTTFVVILAGICFGSTVGLVVGAVSALVSNMFLGQGPWTIWQMLAWGLCGASAGIFIRLFPGRSKWALVIFAFIWGYLFGWIMNIWHWLSFVYPLNFKSWLMINAASFWFDTLHALSNTFFILILGGDFIKILLRFKRRLLLSYI